MSRNAGPIKGAPFATNSSLTAPHHCWSMVAQVAYAIAIVNGAIVLDLVFGPKAILHHKLRFYRMCPCK